MKTRACARQKTRPAPVRKRLPDAWALIVATLSLACLTGCQPWPPSAWFSQHSPVREPPSADVRDRLTPASPVPVQYHLVRKGETLAAIGREYDMSWKEIAKANGMADPNRLAPGQRLVIPAPGAAETPYVREVRMRRRTRSE